MVLDSRSRVDSIEVINGNDANPVSNGSRDSGYTTIDLIASKSSQNPVGKWWGNLGLQAKTTLVSVAAITIPLLMLGGFTYVYIGQNITKSTQDAKASRAEAMAYRVAYFMRERYGDIQVLANLPIFNNPKVQSVVSLAEQKVILESYIKSYGTFYDGIAVYRLDGTLIVDAGPFPNAPNAFKQVKQEGQDGFFQTVLKTDKPFITQTEASIVTNKLSIYTAAPIKDISTGKTIAIIRARVPVSEIEATIKDFNVGGEQYHLSESNGKFFVALEKDQVGRDLKTDFPKLAPIVDKRELGSAASINLISNKEQFVGYSPLPKIEGLPDLKWDAVIAVDEDIALKPVQQLLLILVGATTAVSVLAVVLAIAISRRATRPIIEATAAVSKLGKGNLDTRLAVKGEDEIAQLGENINSMAGQLQTFLALQETQARRSQILAEVSRSRDLNELDAPLSSYMAEIRQELNCDRVVVYKFVIDAQGKGLGSIVAESGLDHLSSAMNAGLSDPCIPEELIVAYKQGRVVATSDVFNAGFAPAHLDLMRKLQIKSNLVVPVLRAGELDSLLIAHSCREPRDWQEPEIEMMQSYAEEIGRALGGLATLEQQRLVADQERNRSEAIQRELITLLSDVEGAVNGDLTVRAQISAGEIGIVADFFNAIVESLRDVVSQVKIATGQVSTSVNTNNDSIRLLAGDATLQAKQLDDALQSVEQMTESIQQVASNARQAADASNESAQTAETGSLAIEQSASSILQLRQTVAETTKKVKRLGEASQQISKVVVLIDQIALKTNMLAVNASIEAARAGEEGRGFAVVAEEVGALAAQSATATKEIARIVETIQQETSEVVESMEASTLQVVEGTNKVEDARKSLSQIVEVAKKVNELFQGILIATTSQVQTSQSVKLVMENLSTQSQKSSETSREVAIALQETADVASKLQASVETFKVDAA